MFHDFQSTLYLYCFICPILSAVSFSSHPLPARGPNRPSLLSSPWPGQGGRDPRPAHGRGGHPSCGDVCHWVRGGGLWWRGSFLSDERTNLLPVWHVWCHAAPRELFSPHLRRSRWLWDWLEAGSALQIRLGCFVGFMARIALVWKVSSGDGSHGCVRAACGEAWAKH